MAKRCPLCTFRASDDTELREHLRAEHEWDPSNDLPLINGLIGAAALLVAATMAIIVVLGSAICFSSSGFCGQIGMWTFAALASLGVAIVVLVRPRRRTHQPRGAAAGRATKSARPRMTASERARLQRLHAGSTAVIAIAFSGMFLYKMLPEEIGLWVTVVSFVILAVAAIARMMIRRRLLNV